MARAEIPSSDAPSKPIKPSLLGLRTALDNLYRRAANSMGQVRGIALKVEEAKAVDDSSIRNPVREAEMTHNFEEAFRRNGFLPGAGTIFAHAVHEINVAEQVAQRHARTQGVLPFDEINEESNSLPDEV